MPRNSQIKLEIRKYPGPYDEEGKNLLACMCAKSLWLCLAVCDLINCSPPGSSVHGIFQARIREWVAVAFSRGSS